MEIKDFPNYLIYDDGRVYSKKRKGTDGGFITWKTKKDGYKVVQLYKDGKAYNKRISRLVAEHYIPNDKNYDFVDHIDRNKSNNNVSNLRWCNRSINNHNTEVSKNNKLNIKNICFYKAKNTYIFSIMINKKLHQKRFKTLQEALEYKNLFTQNNN